jgi:nucleotide-binding universal stress UspA family protein
MFRKILIPYDFSPCADAAVEFAKRMAERGGVIRLVFAVERSAPVPYGERVALDEARREVQGRLERLALDVASSADVRTSSCVLFGSCWRVAVDEAAKLGADAIFMGSHGRRGGMRLLLGSVAERVIRAAKIPVCVVKAGKVAAGKISRIGLATDLCMASSAATKIARKVARRHRAALDVIHVFAGGDEPTRTAVATRLTTAPQRDSDLAVRTTPAGVRTRDVVTAGDVPERLTSYAEQEQLDLLIMGTRARKGLSRLLIGSMAAETMRTLRCPLLIVPQAAEGRGTGVTAR